MSSPETEAEITAYHETGVHRDVKGVRERRSGGRMISEAAWDKGIRDLYRTCKEDGVFCYLIFKATGTKTAEP
jgi:hypothetical protein